MREIGPGRDESRWIRHDRLLNTYGIIVDQYRHEDERYADSLNIMALLQTILFAGFIQLSLISPDQLAREMLFMLLKLMIPFLGIFLCVNALYAFHRRIEAMIYWSNQARCLEKDEDFWFTHDEKLDRDLDIFTARHSHLEKRKSRYPRIVVTILRYQRYFLPVLFLLQWALVICFLLIYGN
ncbi:MAG TPA: hypothetical protein VK436_07535 [Methanocella sp.]|nr:hypothetical protein [Methanocella sp.]